jgi:UDP-N-acetylmuramate dehydrogenase
MILWLIVWSANWYGAENLSLIPGEVGAAAVQNIGGLRVEVKDLIQSVEVMDASGKELLYPLPNAAMLTATVCSKNPRMNHLIVTSVTFALSKNTGL